MRRITDNVVRPAARPVNPSGFATRHVSKMLSDLANLEEEDLAARRDWEEDAYEIIPRAGLSDF